MKALWSLTLLFICLIAVAQEPQSVHDMLTTLDRTIEQKQIYNTQKETQIATIKNKFADSNDPASRYEVCDELFHAYNKFQLDSALHYADCKQVLALSIGQPEQKEAQLNHADLLCTMGMYKEALDIMNGIRQEELRDKQVPYFYHLHRTIYGAMADFALTEPEKLKYEQLTNVYRDSILLNNPEESLTYTLVSADKMIVDKKYHQALDLLEKKYLTCTDMHGKGLMAYNMSEAYRGIGDSEKQIRNLALSATIDLKLPVKEYTSLIKLATLLFEAGDIGRAYKYLNCAMEDAVACNARLRTFEITQMYPIVDKAYQQREAKNKQLRMIFTLCITLLSVILLISILYIYKQMKKLTAARKALSDANSRLTEVNVKLSEVNAALSESNQIKQEYIAHYLDQCTLYIDKLETYRRSLANMAIASKVSELFIAIKSQQFIEDEREKFYKEFDRTFLNLFPHFVDSFNNLLTEDGRIYPKPGELLCTELRIFALIRLGISDSNKIARFLSYSLATIYNYRSKVRNKARGDKSDFEQEIMKING